MSATTRVTARRAGLPLTAALAALALLAAMLLVLAPSAHAAHTGRAAHTASAARSAVTGRVLGEISGKDGVNKIRMTWFTQDWHYLGKRKVNRGAYSLSLRPGTYWIQFTDRRPTYDVTKYAPSDIKVRVRAHKTTIKRVVMRRGAAITGIVTAGGKPARGARLVAANTAEQSFEVKANKQGQFALGGLPAGSYSVFTYERTSQWTGKSSYVPGLKPGDVADIAIQQTKHAGKLLVLLSAGGKTIHKPVFVTAISRATGQFWTERSTRDGSVSFDGLFRGRYRLVMPGVGDYLARNGNVTKAKVRANHLAIGTFNLTRRGASVEGIVVDKEDPSYPLPGAAVLLVNKTGDTIGEDVTNSDGHFSFGGAITTQSGLTVVAQPGGYTAYLGEDTHYCLYGRTTSDRFSVRTGRSSDIGAIELAHLPKAEQGQSVNCYPSDGS